MPGFAFDLTVNDPDDGQPWDFFVKGKREKARAKLNSQKPYLLIGSPSCSAFSTWMALNEARSNDVAAVRRAKSRAVRHIEFVIELYYDQLNGGRYFLHEHPEHATSWQLASMKALTEAESVLRVCGDQCQYGAEIQRGMRKGHPIKKPIGFLTNSPRVAEALSARCAGSNGECSRAKGGRHAPCAGGHAAAAARYPRGLCRAILRGITKQGRDDSILKDGCFGLQVRGDDADVEAMIRGPAQGYTGKYKDDLTGQVLKDSMVAGARAKELTFFYAKGVWLKRPHHTAGAKTGRPPISVRWVDVNKGDDVNPNYRSRLVARELKAMDKSNNSYFAPAPPLEAFRTVLSSAMTRIGKHQPVWDPLAKDRTQISFIDVKRAYFNAKIDSESPPVFVELPHEDADCGVMSAQLLRHMYGTRGAADGWQEEYSTMLIGRGFVQGESCPNVFWHQAKDMLLCPRRRFHLLGSLSST